MFQGPKKEGVLQLGGKRYVYMIKRKILEVYEIYGFKMSITMIFLMFIS